MEVLSDKMKLVTVITVLVLIVCGFVFSRGGIGDL